MNIKKNSGFTGIDVSISLIIIMIFIGSITAILYNFQVKSRQIDRKSQATQIIIEILEFAKSANFEDLNQEYLNNFKDTNYSSLKGYNINVSCQNDKDILEMETNTQEVNAKKVIVNVSYLVNNETKNLSIYTWIVNN